MRAGRRLEVPNVAPVARCSGEPGPNFPQHPTGSQVQARTGPKFSDVVENRIDQVVATVEDGWRRTLDVVLAINVGVGGGWDRWRRIVAQAASRMRRCSSAATRLNPWQRHTLIQQNPWDGLCI